MQLSIVRFALLAKARAREHERPYSLASTSPSPSCCKAYEPL